jgi:hypothetical protein
MGHRKQYIKLCCFVSDAYRHVYQSDRLSKTKREKKKKSTTMRHSFSEGVNGGAPGRHAGSLAESGAGRGRRGTSVHVKYFEARGKRFRKRQQGTCTDNS